MTFRLTSFICKAIRALVVSIAPDKFPAQALTPKSVLDAGPAKTKRNVDFTFRFNYFWLIVKLVVKKKLEPVKDNL